MKRLVALLLLLALSSSAAQTYEEDRYEGQCNYKRSINPRPHSVSILEFGAIGDGKTLNTVAFQNAIFYAKSFADKGGAQLYVPAGNWLTGSFNLTSHLTLFLERGATILGSQNFAHWDVMEPLPSYGRGIELPGKRYRSLINGQNLTDVWITGDNGTIDGQASIWWEQFNSHSLNYSRPHLVEFIYSDNIIISNLTFLNSPAWNIHPVYCSNFWVQNISIHTPFDSPYTSGIVPDSSVYVCIENCNISTGYDAIVLKSGWDEYGIAFGKPTSNVHIKTVNLQSFSGSGLAFGTEMSGGISNILGEQIRITDSVIGIELKTSRGRGGYMKEIFMSDVNMENLELGIKAMGQNGSHPDDGYDPNALPIVEGITFENIIGTNVTYAGIFSGISDSPFTAICLINVYFSIDSESSASSISWLCSNVMGFSAGVLPEPCYNLEGSPSNSSEGCFSLLHPYIDLRSAVL